MCLNIIQATITGKTKKNCQFKAINHTHTRKINIVSHIPVISGSTGINNQTTPF